jgi:hypothetical protein
VINHTTASDKRELFVVATLKTFNESRLYSPFPGEYSVLLVREFNYVAQKVIRNLITLSVPRSNFYFAADNGGDLFLNITQPRCKRGLKKNLRSSKHLAGVTSRSEGFYVSQHLSQISATWISFSSRPVPMGILFEKCRQKSSQNGGSLLLIYRQIEASAFRARGGPWMIYLAGCWKNLETRHAAKNVRR